MNLLCICPTYGRPSLAANAAACFAKQRLAPADFASLVIYDDALQIPAQVHLLSDQLDLRVVSSPFRERSLPAKYNRMLESMNVDDYDAVVVWDDDDIYLPWHLASLAAALHYDRDAVAAKPSKIWSLYQTKVPFVEDATGRFHGSLAIRTERLKTIGGWPKTGRVDFDQMLMAQCAPMADSLPYCCGPTGNFPSYIYRWQSTQAHHCSGDASGPDDESWYQRVPITEPGTFNVWKPMFDAETAAIYSGILV